MVPAPEIAMEQRRLDFKVIREEQGKALQDLGEGVKGWGGGRQASSATTAQHPTHLLAQVLDRPTAWASVELVAQPVLSPKFHPIL